MKITRFEWALLWKALKLHVQLSRFPPPLLIAQLPMDRPLRLFAHRPLVKPPPRPSAQPPQGPSGLTVTVSSTATQGLKPGCGLRQGCEPARGSRPTGTSSAGSPVTEPLTPCWSWRSTGSQGREGEGRMKGEGRAGKSSLHFCDHRAAASFSGGSPWPTGSSLIDGFMSASCLLSGAPAHIVISSCKSRCSVVSALISPPRTQDSQPPVFTFPKPWSGRRCSKMILKQQDGDPLVSCEINFMGCNQHYQQQQNQVGCVKKGICMKRRRISPGG